MSAPLSGPAESDEATKRRRNIVHASPHIVGDVMTRAVAAVGRGAAFNDIGRTMQDRGVSALAARPCPWWTERAAS
jgi:hypothetical protein